MQQFHASPLEMFMAVWRNRSLVVAFTKREIIGRYRGSVLGLLWSFFYPVFMLAVYTFVFSIIFRARWSGGNESKTEFALVLFAGLIVFNLFAECINRAPASILSNINYVKKVVFPLEIFPWINLGAALFHAFISIGVWLLFYLFTMGVPPLTVLLLPLVLLPLALLILGCSWFLASIGVFLRDVMQLVSIFTTVLMFLSPIFYPVEAIPPKYQPFLYLNPLAPAIGQMRDILYWGKLFDPWIYLLYLLFCFFIAWLGFGWFQRTRKGFADVL